MAIEIETLVLQAKQLSRAQRVQLIARLSADLAQDVPDEPKSHQSLDELLLTAKPWQGLKHPLENQPNPEVTDFLEMRKEQREQDKELEKHSENRLRSIWDS